MSVLFDWISSTEIHVYKFGTFVTTMYVTLVGQDVAEMLNLQVSASASTDVPIFDVMFSTGWVEWVTFNKSGNSCIW